MATKQFGDDDVDNYLNSIEDEVVALQSIYEDKLVITKQGNLLDLSIMLYPATAEDTKSQYVCLLLKLSVHTSQNPEAPVGISIQQSRGLSDERLQKISLLLTNHATNNVGDSVLFDLIEMAKDSLTINNIPSCPCPVCLADFQNFDDFLKTECFHYLHSYCMYEYAVHWLEENKKNNQSTPPYLSFVPGFTSQNSDFLPCPVCREPVSYDLHSLKTSTKPIETRTDDFNFDRIKAEMMDLQKVYLRQKENGGIINLEAEKNKYLLSNIAQAYAVANAQKKDEEETSISSKANDSESCTSSSTSRSQADQSLNLSDLNANISITSSNSKTTHNPKSCDAPNTQNPKSCSFSNASNSKSRNISHSRRHHKSSVSHESSEAPSFKMPQKVDEAHSKSRDTYGGSNHESFGSHDSSHAKSHKPHHTRRLHSNDASASPNSKSRDFSDVSRFKSRDASRKTRNSHRRYDNGRRHVKDRQEQNETLSSNRPSSTSTRPSRGARESRIPPRCEGKVFNRSDKFYSPRQVDNTAYKHRPKPNSATKDVSSQANERTKTSVGN